MKESHLISLPLNPEPVPTHAKKVSKTHSSTYLQPSMSCSIFHVFLFFWQAHRFVPTALAQQTCYVPDGTEVGIDTPCGPTSTNQASPCCDPRDTCLSNGLCLNSLLYISRGSCTDRSWRSDGCVPWCQDCMMSAEKNDKSLVNDRSRWYDMWIVSPNQGRAIVQVEDRLFCCGFFNSSSGTCYNSTRGSDAPFTIDQGSVILDRWSGLTAPNNSLATVAASPVTLAGSTVNSVTTITTTAAGPAASLPSSDRAATVDVAVDMPLALALLGFVVMLWRQKREAAELKKEKKDLEEKYITLLQSSLETRRSGNNIPRALNEQTTRHELEEGNIGELAS